MNRRLTLARTAVVTAVAAVGAAAAMATGSNLDFDRYFLAKTMRVDYFHTGHATAEIISLDRVVADGPWAGSRTKLIDGTDLGKYLFEVHDAATETLL